MLVNFCDECLGTEVRCSSACTEGYEASNLRGNSGKGFLAYSCIRPPVAIDFLFIANVQISHVAVWAQVGGQKSCGFRLSVKTSDGDDEPFTDISTGFIDRDQTGVWFYRRDIVANDLDEMAAPPPQQFAKRSMRPVDATNHARTLRLCIVKTYNSVPAVGRIEIWGRVSRKCPRDAWASVTSLWSNRFNDSTTAAAALETPLPPKQKNPNRYENEYENEYKNEEEEKEEEEGKLKSLNVPEEFLDPITLEIMTQPIILPSGKIIDQKTLERHGDAEAQWGRSVSDPFTAMPFNDLRRPVAALPLKARIDKFLLDHSDEAEIKELPRVLGTTRPGQCNSRDHLKATLLQQLLLPCRTQSTSPAINTNSNGVDVAKGNNATNRWKRALPRQAAGDPVVCNLKKPRRGHRLPPVVPLRSRSKQQQQQQQQEDDITSTTDIRVTDASSPACDCSTDRIFYKLPCQHIICRKTLLSLAKNECTNCKQEFKTSEPQRYHLLNST